MKEIDKSLVELQKHHLDKIERLTSGLKRKRSSRYLAKKDTDRIVRVAPEYLLDNPQYKEQLELAVAAAIEAYRHGEIRPVPDGQADFICVNCHNSKCPHGLEPQVRLARIFLVDPQEWEARGIKPLSLDYRKITNPQMQLIYGS